MNKELIAKLNESIDDELDLIKSFVFDRVKIIERLKDKILEEINNE